MAATFVDGKCVDLESSPVARCGVLRGAQGRESIHAVEFVYVSMLWTWWPGSVSKYPISRFSGSLERSGSWERWRTGYAWCCHGHGRSPAVRVIVHGGALVPTCVHFITQPTCSSPILGAKNASEWSHIARVMWLL
jgi:hypothetical protein